MSRMPAPRPRAKRARPRVVGSEAGREQGDGTEGVAREGEGLRAPTIRERASDENADD
jgi:hypothetical protein